MPRRALLLVSCSWLGWLLFGAFSQNPVVEGGAAALPHSTSRGRVVASRGLASWLLRDRRGGVALVQLGDGLRGGKAAEGQHSQPVFLYALTQTWMRS